MSGIDLDLWEEEFDDLDDARHRRRRGTKRSTKAQERIDDADRARVVAVARGLLEVYFDDERHPARFGGSMRGTKVVVGDEVRIRPPRHDTDVVRVLGLEERRTWLTRTPDDDADVERVVVANAEAVGVVVAGDRIVEAVGFVDRVLVAGSVGGLEPLVVVNKMDLADPAIVAEAMAPYRDLDVTVVQTSAEARTGLDDLEDALQGRWTAFTGHSGVGKSSLFNLVVPAAEQDVAELGRRGGRHTTVAAIAEHAPDLDAWLVDTPGVRSFGLGTLAPDELVDHFPELADLGCDLDDCAHLGEPGCRLDVDAVAPTRWSSYLRIREGLLGQ
ncbi:ribosome small subunit-dependent GTPase A [Salsipaludibacter albus]|uniref:ribosome small subunit-dependent GTPase A n=1 Tax=Salsipaludibacter albus TaxID=2849650 RepID=UPI001EE47255|nr:ribosome small subunit-dependent GTPase A [Salsipaludibacter albus]MBY5161736.1 ribosome small subunit-dependent GTPase A [Salsipaludibacter albus]